MCGSLARARGRRPVEPAPTCYLETLWVFTMTPSELTQMSKQVNEAFFMFMVMPRHWTQHYSRLPFPSRAEKSVACLLPPSCRLSCLLSRRLNCVRLAIQEDVIFSYRKIFTHSESSRVASAAQSTFIAPNKYYIHQETARGRGVCLGKRARPMPWARL